MWHTICTVKLQYHVDSNIQLTKFNKECLKKKYYQKKVPQNDNQCVYVENKILFSLCYHIQYIELIQWKNITK